MGVDKALNKVEELRRDEPEKSIATIGPLIHNHRVLEYLETKGIDAISSPSQADDGIVVIRAHGLPPKEQECYLQAGLTLVDATCPRVLASQKRVAKRSGQGKFIVIVGDPGHGEVKGIAGFAPPGGVAVVSSPDEAEKLTLTTSTLVIAQTTIRQEEYDAVVAVLQQKGADLEVAPSICPATLERQEALKQLALEVDAIIIIGGKNSANTTALYTTAVDTGKPSWHIEGLGEIPRDISNFERIGISAGASTPDWIIREVEEALEAL